MLVVRRAGRLRALLPRFAGPFFERSGEEELYCRECHVVDIVIRVAGNGSEERRIVEGEPAPEHAEGSNRGALCESTMMVGGPGSESTCEKDSHEINGTEGEREGGRKSAKMIL